MRTPLSLPALLLVAAALAACSKEAPPAAPPGDARPSPYALAADPAPGKGLTVLDAKAGGPKDDVVVVGRVKDFVDGPFAAFTLADTALTYCGYAGENMPECETPWDYCCTPKDELTAGMLAVAVKDEAGETVSIPRIPELRNLDLVAVRGRLVKDKSGDLILEATGWWRRERPKLPDGLKFR